MRFHLQRDYDWDSSKGYETKEKSVGKLYISNVNNIKGLEFPFVICVVTRTITTNILSRNSIYMALTRSFLTSYFIVDNRNSEFVEIYSAAIARITNEGKMELHEPSPDERKEMANRIRITLSSSRKSFEEIMDDFFNKEYPYLKLEDRKFVADTIKQISANLTEEQIKQRSRYFVDVVLGAGKA